MGRGLHLCRTWCGIVYVAFVVDVFLRAVVGWSAATSKRAERILDALDMAFVVPGPCRNSRRPGLVHHSDAGSQYTSSAFTVHLLDAGTDASIGTVGDALDNALTESRIGLYKTELINSRRPWHGLADVELGAAEWVEAGRRRVVRDVGVPSGHPETPLADGIRDSPSPS